MGGVGVEGAPPLPRLRAGKSPTLENARRLCAIIVEHFAPPDALRSVVDRVVHTDGPDASGGGVVARAARGARGGLSLPPRPSPRPSPPHPHLRAMELLGLKALKNVRPTHLRAKVGVVVTRAVEARGRANPPSPPRLAHMS